MSREFRLITGRTRKQADGLHQGKDSETYQQATALVEMSSDDMARLDIEEGAIVRLRTTTGAVEVPAQTGELPSGLLFMPMGPTVNTLIEAETDGTGIPPFKELMVEVAPV